MVARAAVAVLALAGCTVSPLSGAGRPCTSSEACGGGTVCDPVRGLCVEAGRDLGGERPSFLEAGALDQLPRDAAGEAPRADAGQPPVSPYVTSPDGWGWRHPLPQGNALHGVFALSASAAWAVGAGGTILRFDGNRWHPSASGTKERLNAVWAASGTAVWAAGDKGTLLRYDGNAWSPESLPGAPIGNLTAIGGTGPQNVWVAGSGPSVFRQDGSGWTQVPLSVGGVKEVTDLWVASADEVWFATGKDLLRLKAGSTTKFPPRGVDPRGIWGAADDDIWAVGNGYLHYSGGADWEEPIVTTTGLEAVWGTGAGAAWAVGKAGSLRHYQGTWNDLPSLVPVDLHALHGAGGKAWAVGERGATLRLDGAWAIFGALATVRNLAGAWGPKGSQTLFAVGAGGDILHFDGTAWALAPSGTTKNLTAVWGAGATVLAVGDGGTALRHDGTAWQAMSAGTSEPLRGLHGCSPGEAWAVGGSCSCDVYGNCTCKAVATRYDGNVWSSTNPGGSKVLNAVFCDAGSQTLWAVGEEGQIFRRVAGSTSWKSESAPGNASLFAVWAASGQLAWAGGSGGVLLRFDGTTWTAVPSGTTVSIRGLWGSGPADLWAVGDLGTILHYDGTSWKPAASGTSGKLSAVFGRGTKDVWAVGDGATVLHYDDRLP